MTGPDLLLLAVLAVGLTVAVVLLRGVRPRLRQAAPPAPVLPPEPLPEAEPEPPVDPDPEPPEPWDEAAELRRLVDGAPELQALYEKIGYPPGVEREAERLTAGLAALVRAEVPDWEAFDAALSDAEAQLASQEGGSAGERYRSEDEELLREVLATRADRDEVLRLLNRDPAGRLLPFVEQLPLVRNGEVVWRTPMELTLIRKRPADAEAFQRQLDELERLVRTVPLRRKPPARETVLAALSRLRRDLARPNAYLPTPVQALAAAADDWLHRAHEPALRRCREELDGLLLGLLRVRHAHETGGGREAEPRETARRLAQLYAGQPWMHTPWLTTCVLTSLLDAELTLLPEGDGETPGSPAVPAAVIRLVRDEVASRHYDSDETIRRLRQQEDKGVYVHSLVYALLRMNRLPGGGSEEPSSGLRQVDPRKGSWP